MTIHLSKDLETFVHEAVRAGLYADEEDVIRDALNRLEQALAEGALAPGKSGDRAERAAPAAADPDESALTDAESANQEMQRRLFNAGLVSEIKPPIRDLAPYRDRKPVPITGEPLSETVIRERR